MPSTEHHVATEFEADLAAGRLRDATDRWGGVFLAGLEDLGDERWTSWLEGERAALTHASGADHRLASNEIVSDELIDAAQPSHTCNTSSG